MPTYRATVSTWRTGLPVNVFTQIPNTASFGGLGVGSATVNAWNGPAASDNAWYWFASGGHLDSGENKLIKTDYTTVVPSFTILDAGSAVQLPLTAALYYNDGKPVSRHNYYCAQYIPSRDRIMSFGALAANTDAANSGKVDGFSLSANAYDPAATWTDCPHVHIAMSVARDPRTDDVWISSDGQFHKWTAATASWAVQTVVGAAGGAWEFKPACVDPLRNLLVHPNGVLQLVDLSTLIATNNTITGTYPGVTADYDPVVYDPDNDRYVTINGTTMYAIDPVTLVSTTLATGLPAAANSSINTRLTYLPALHGFMYLPTFTSNLLFFPTRVM